jgi:hypothetical protein
MLISSKSKSAERGPSALLPKTPTMSQYPILPKMKYICKRIIVYIILGWYVLRPPTKSVCKNYVFKYWHIQ